jgi:hypothetical protein
MPFENSDNMAGIFAKAAANFRYENDIDQGQLMSVLAMHNGQSPK